MLNCQTLKQGVEGKMRNTGLYGFVSLAAWLLVVLSLAGCAGTPPVHIDLMPAPDIYSQGVIDPFADEYSSRTFPYQGMLYATNRQPATEDDKARFYTSKRGHVTRLGLASINLGEDDIDWEEARRISLLKNRADTYPLSVDEVEEFGVLEASAGAFDKALLAQPDPDAPGKQFAGLVNAGLAQAGKKDVFIYVHGYKVVFENPLLVASELWHFLGYDGVFVAFSWPSTPHRLAYVADVETAAYSARNLRILIEYLARETAVERIHIVAYSAGTRVVLGALGELTLAYLHSGDPAAARKLRLGNIVLVGSDFDRDQFAGYLDDGVLGLADHLYIYLSTTDKALAVSNWLYTRERLGQMWQGDKTDPVVVDYLQRNPGLVLIDVTGAEQAAAGNGHDYFRKSPWVSSDVLVTLRYGLEPRSRGLVRTEENPVWRYPADYLVRLRQVLREQLPAP
jgi:esterase/lipase superfamily enzyme